MRNFKRFDEEEFQRDLLDILFSDVKAAASDANELWDIWKNFLLAVLNKHAPPTTLRVKGRQLPYLTNEIKQLRRQRDYIKKVMVNTKFDFKLINAIEVYNKLKTLDKNKATGIHNIPNKMLLLCADTVAPHLVDIFNYSLVSKIFWMILKLARYLLFLKMEREREKRS